MKYISVQPRTIYFAWQVEVMLNNFIKIGIPETDIQILLACKESDKEQDIKIWDRIITHFKNVQFYTYSDTRDASANYVSGVRPNILKQHFLIFPDLKDEFVFYHDCDIVFTKPVDFNHLLKTGVWYLSDTNSYIGYDYINSKGNGIYDKMCEIVGIDNRIPKLMNKHGGGAQYIMNGLTADYWEKVEKDCESLFTQITDINNFVLKSNPEFHTIQIWCADMWAVLWNAWLYGFQTEISDDLQFCWPLEHVDKWETCNIFHNSGAQNKSAFAKSRYKDIVPYSFHGAPNLYDPTLCTYNYFNEIIETSSKSCFVDLL